MLQHVELVVVLRQSFARRCRAMMEKVFIELETLKRITITTTIVWKTVKQKREEREDHDRKIHVLGSL